MRPGTGRSHPTICIVRSATLGSLNWYHWEQDVRKGEQTRQEIIRKAAPIFNQKGYEGAALSDLMRATGLEKGGICRHFGEQARASGRRLRPRLENRNGYALRRHRASEYR
jgi:hypothetical protein